MIFSFDAEVWVWDARRSDTWTFVTIPLEHSQELRARIEPARGFGSIPVEVSIGATTWRTSVFPDKESGCYVLPVKKAVRVSESISAGDTVGLTVTTR